MDWTQKLHNTLGKINDFVLNVACLLLCVLVTACILMVLTRFIPGFTLTGLEEIARYSFIYLAFLSIGVGVYRSEHPGLTLLDSALSGNKKLYLHIFVNVAILTFGLIFIIYGYEASYGVRRILSTSWRIPLKYIYFATVCGGTLITINSINNMIQLTIAKKQNCSISVEE